MDLEQLPFSLSIFSLVAVVEAAAAAAAAVSLLPMEADVLRMDPFFCPPLDSKRPMRACEGERKSLSRREPDRAEDAARHPLPPIPVVARFETEE